MKYFSKIKKAILGALLTACLLLVGVGISACGDNASEKNAVPELFGFDVGETINVDQYGLVCPENVHVTDAEGTMYDVVVKVRDSKGKVISTDEGNKFNAYDAEGYTITYSIETWKFTLTKTVQVVVTHLYSEGGQAIWDCTTIEGEKVSPGVYLIFVSDSTGKES